MRRLAMVINTENLVSITETNQNFSRVARLVDRTGAAVVLKNNTPRYVILDFNQLQEDETASSSEALASARKLLKKHLPAFKELAK
jgi:antitoxin Phd